MKMMRKLAGSVRGRIVGAVLAAACVNMPAIAQAQESPRGWFLHIGPLGVLFDSSARVSVAGLPVPGGDAEAEDNVTLAFDIGYRFNERFSMSLTGGIPPTTDLNGKGALSGAGRLGSVKYAPAVLAVQYRFATGNPRFQPYVGVGVNYTRILESKDGAVSGLEVDDPIGPVLQVGFESMVTDRMGFYVDAKKLWIDTTATGTVGGNPAVADVTLNPLLVGAGLVFRF